MTEDPRLNPIDPLLLPFTARPSNLTDPRPSSSTAATEAISQEEDRRWTRAVEAGWEVLVEEEEDHREAEWAAEAGIRTATAGTSTAETIASVAGKTRTTTVRRRSGLLRRHRLLKVVLHSRPRQASTSLVARSGLTRPTTGPTRSRPPSDAKSLPRHRLRPKLALLHPSLLE